MECVLAGLWCSWYYSKAWQRIQPHKLGSALWFLEFLVDRIQIPDSMTIEPHNLWILSLQICLLMEKMKKIPQSNTCDSRVAVCGYASNVKSLCHSARMSYVTQGDALPSHFDVHAGNCDLSHDLLSATSFTFGGSWWWVFCLKCSKRRGLRRAPVCSPELPLCFLRKRVHQIHLIQAWVILRLSVNESIIQYLQEKKKSSLTWRWNFSGKCWSVSATKDELTEKTESCWICGVARWWGRVGGFVKGIADSIGRGLKAEEDFHFMQDRRILNPFSARTPWKC